MVTALNRHQPYGEIFGTPEALPMARYVQDGRCFDISGAEVTRDQSICSQDELVEHDGMEEATASSAGTGLKYSMDQLTSMDRSALVDVLRRLDPDSYSNARKLPRKHASLIERILQSQVET